MGALRGRPSKVYTHGNEHTITIRGEKYTFRTDSKGRVRTVEALSDTYLEQAKARVRAYIGS